MPEVFPAGYIALKEWIEREAGIRFGLMSPEGGAERLNIILDELSHKLAVGASSIAVAISDLGHQQDAPVFIWRRSEAERRKMLATGAAPFNVAGQWTPYRIGIWAAFTLVPKRPVPRVQMSEAEKIALRARAQRAGISIGSLAGSAPDLVSFSQQRVTPKPLAGQPVTMKRPSVVTQKRDIKRVLGEYAAKLKPGEKPTESQLIQYAKGQLGYAPARAHVRAWADEPENRHLKRALGDRPILGKRG